MLVQHSSKHSNWITPSYIIKMVTEVLGEIELDPASDNIANEIVQAKKYYTQKDDSLNMKKWCSTPKTIYLNPPGGKVNNQSLSALYWGKLMQHLEAGLVKHAIYMGFSLEQLRVTQNYHKHSIPDFPVCIPRQRIKFLDPTMNGRERPSHANVIVYIPGRISRTIVFRDVFEDIGKTMTTF